MTAARVVVVGAINIDFVITTPHLPAAGETVVGDRLATFGGGKGANAAVAAARAGADVALIGAVGGDEWGANALISLQADGVDTSGVATLEQESTGAALIVVDAHGENQIALGPGANGAVCADHVRAMLATLPSADVVLVSSEIPLAAVAAAVETASQAGVTCMLNPAPVIPGLDTLLAMSPIVTPNEIELAELVRGLGDAPAGGDPGDRIAAALRLLARCTKAPVVATLGGDGSLVGLPGADPERVPAHPADNVVDTTGAGDTFNGVLAARLAAGDAMMLAVRTAAVAASLSVTASGARAGMPTAAAIRAAMDAAPNGDRRA